MRIWRTFAGVCWTGKRFDFDGGAQEVLGRGRNPPVTALPCQPPLGKGAMRTGGRIATASVRTGFAMTGFCMECGTRPGGRTEASAPTEGNKKPCGAGRRGRRPLRMGRGVRIATAVNRSLVRNDTVFARGAMGGRPQGSPLRKRCKERGGAGDCEGRPCGSVTWSAWRRDDVGSELSAASGRGSEVSEWPRSKLGASAVRQRRNFGHRNRVIVPCGAQRAYYFDF